jgi:hypothetical protein
MAISTPVTITVNAVPIVLNKIQFDGIASTYYYANATTSYHLRIRHGTVKPNKDGTIYQNHNVEFVKTTLAVPGVSPAIEDKIYFTMVRLATLTDVDLAAGLFVLAQASTNQFLKDLLQLQS